MLGSCNYINENNIRCNRTFKLHNMIFRDPNAHTYLITIDLCDFHYNEITDQLNERIQDFTIRLSNLIAQKARERKMAKENDVYYDQSHVQQKIDDLIILKRKIQTEECRNFFCMQNLRQLNPFQKLYSVHTFKTNGKRHYSFYFCSLKCFNFIKAKCGISIPIQKGQTIL